MRPHLATTTEPLPPPPDEQTTIGAAREWMQHAVVKGTECPLCEQRAQLYVRKLSGTMIAVLVSWYRHNREQGDTNDWLHVTSWLATTNLSPSIKGGGDWAKMKYWGFIEPQPNTDKEKSSNGFWRITPQGVEFILGLVKVQSYFLVFNDQPFAPVGDDVPMVGVHEALGVKFSFDELVNGRKDISDGTSLSHTAHV